MRLALRARSVTMLDRAPEAGTFLADVLQGLRAPRKRIPCKYFYDERGSRLFEAICDLPEYYITRAELSILEDHGQEVAASLGPGCLVIEYGSGSGLKTRLLLDRLEETRAYVPIDISAEALRRSAEELSAAYPGLEILPVCADYTAPFEIPTPRSSPSRRVVFFPGSTIGNLSPPEARAFLAGAAGVVGRGGAVVVGVDLKKDAAMLEAAYNDRRGVTAAFNKNLLVRINAKLGGDFHLERFRHRAVYNAAMGRIEMYLVSLARQTVRVDGEPIRFMQGEPIHTEDSYKYEAREFSALAARAGLLSRAVWIDPDRRFSVHYLTAH